METSFSYEFKVRGFMECRFFHEFIGFGAMATRFSYEFIGFVISFVALPCARCPSCPGGLYEAQCATDVWFGQHC